MAGTPEGGRKAAAKVKQKYGERVFAEWGRRASRTGMGGFANLDRDKASEIAIKGGQSGHRARSITLDDKLRPDEWGVLLKLVNSTADKIRLSEGEESMSAIDQHSIYHKVFDYWEKEDWVGAMLNISDHPKWAETFEELLADIVAYYNKQIAGQPRHSEDRETARIYRNLAAAYKVAQEGANGKKE